MTYWDDLIKPHGIIGRRKALKSIKLKVTKAEREEMLRRSLEDKTQNLPENPSKKRART